MEQPPGDAVSDESLLKAVAAGEEPAFEALLARYKGKIYGLSLRMMRQPHDAEEALQDVAWTLWRKAGAFRGHAAVSSWIYRITMNACLMRLRRRPKIPPIPLEEEMGPEYDEGGMTAAPVADWSNLAREAAARKELLERIREAADLLPADYRSAFLLRDVEGLSAEEACEILKISVPALKSRLHRARLLLRKKLADYAAEAGWEVTPSAQPSPPGGGGEGGRMESDAEMP